MQEVMIEGFRVSAQQRHLWLLQQTTPQLPFRTRCAIRITGPQDQQALENAITRTVNRHETLRTTFQLLSGMTVPVQVISDEPYRFLELYDLTKQTGKEQEAAIEKIFSETALRPVTFDLFPLFRAQLAKLSSTESVLILSSPALCADGSSFQRLAQQIAQVYAAQSRDEPASGAMQYADFAEWQNELLESERAAAGRQHWQRDLSQALAVRLAFEKQSAGDFQPQRFQINIGEATADLVRQRAGSLQITPGTFLLACWQTLFWRLTRSSELVVGVAFSGRKYEELESSVGLLSQYLPIVINFEDKDLTFVQLTECVSKAERNAHQWQEYFSWDDLERVCDLPLGGYFPICFAAEETGPAINAGALTFSIFKSDSYVDRFKLRLVLKTAPQTLALELHYDASLFDRDDVSRIANELLALVSDACWRPEAAIGQLEILGKAELERIFGEFNTTNAQIESARCIHELFESQVARLPDARAVVYDANHLTYAQLNERANQLANYLRKLGIGPDMPVGLCLERSLDVIVGLLGILKAGGAYVPLDPGLPRERLETMLRDVRASLVVTRHSLAQSFPQHRAVCLDTNQDLLAAESSENPRRTASPQNLAYVIFTSGSTGKPKGVAVEHRHLVNYCEAIKDRLDLPLGGSYAMVSTLSADLGNTVLFPALTGGGTLHLISEERATDPDAFAEYFKRVSIDYLKIVPSHFSALLSASNPAEIMPRECLILGGEACTWSLMERIRRLSPQLKVVNHYGPTEATIGCVAAEITSAPDQTVTVPLGQPLTNTSAYILDEFSRPVPIGAPGELYIGGAGVTRGYIGHPDLTADKFGPDPFAAEVGARLYKTGDLARFLSDGRIEFLGRVDQQLKVRGYRIEPGEIEARLRNHADVTDCVVVAREDQPGDKRLVAYLVTEFKTVDAYELRNLLREELPDYMVPSAFVSLKSLPLTMNGKIDRRALPAPDLRSQGDTFVGPRNAVELLLTRIWTEVLGIKRIGVYDNFFALGGDSILSIQIIARANHAGLRLSPRQLFQHQTIAELAEVSADGLIDDTAEQGLVTGDAPLTPIQLWFFEQNLPEPHHYNQAMLLEIKDAPDAACLQRAIKELLVHHDALRLRFCRTEDGWRQTIAGDSDLVPFGRIDLSQIPQVVHEAAIEREANRLQASLDLKDALVRTTLFSCGGQENYLLFVVHHLAVDGLSWRIVIEDLELLYEQLKSGKATMLPPKTTSFNRWASLLAEHSQSDLLRQELSCWLSLLSKTDSKCRLPVDHADGVNTFASARTVSVSLSAEETRRLLKDLPALYRTQINEILLTALLRTFAAWTGAKSLLLDMEGHGREEILQGIDVSRTVGWFTSIFPVLLQVGDSPTSLAALRSVKEQLRAIPNRGIGYGLLRYMSRDKTVAAQLRTFPPAEIRFNYLGQTDRVTSESSQFNPATLSSGRSLSSKGNRAYLLNIIGRVSNAELRLEWTYSENIHRGETVERLAHNYLGELRNLITLSQTNTAATYSPSDFPKAKITQTDLDKVLAKIRG